MSWHHELLCIGSCEVTAANGHPVFVTGKQSWDWRLPVLRLMVSTVWCVSLVTSRDSLVTGRVLALLVTDATPWITMWMTHTVLQTGGHWSGVPTTDFKNYLSGTFPHVRTVSLTPFLMWALSCWHLQLIRHCLTGAYFPKCPPELGPNQSNFPKHPPELGWNHTAKMWEAFLNVLLMKQCYEITLCFHSNFH